MLPTLNTEQMVELKSAIKESAGSMTRIAAERDLQKDIKSNMKDEFDIEPKTFGKLVKIYFEQNKSQLVTEMDELIESYDEIFGNSNAE